MRHNPAPLFGPFYTDDSLPWAHQDTVGYLPVAAEVEGTRSSVRLAQNVGLRPWQKIGDGPIRALYTAESRLFVVSGSKAYQVTAGGIGIALGNMPQVGRVQVAHNQIASGNEVIFVNGQSGYLYDTHTQDYSKITDSGYPGAKSVDFIDQYFLQVEPFGRYAFISDLSAGADYNTLDRFQAESSPDRLQCAKNNQGEAVLFGQRTTQFFANTGAATGTFQDKRILIKHGAASPHCVASLDNTLIWVGDDGIVYRLDGYAARRISTGPLERALAQFDLSTCFANVWEDRGFKVYYLTIIGGPTFGYHVENGMWVRQSTWNPRSDIAGRWRPSAMAYFNKQWIAGDAYSGELYVMDWDYFLDRERPLVRERITRVVTDNNNRIGCDYLELEIDSQGSEISIAPSPLFPPQPEAPVLSGAAPDGTIGDSWGPYSYIATGGTPPYRFTSSSKSALIPGIPALTPSGTLPAGTPTESGTFTQVIRVEDSKGLRDELRDQVTIGNPWFAVSDVLGEGYGLKSPTGSDWSGTLNPNLHGTGIFCGDGSIVIVSPAGNRTSFDRGVTWVAHTGPATSAPTGGLYYEDIYYLSAGDGAGDNSRRSLDAVAFEAMTMPSNFGIVYGFAGIFGRVVAVGVQSIGGNATYSDDKGVTWSELTTCFSSNETARSIATDGDVVIAVGNGNLIGISDDGASWRSIESPFTGTNPIVLVSYGLKRFLILNSEGKSATSVDQGASWQISSGALSHSPLSVDSDASRFIVGAEAGAMYISNDGLSFTELDTSFTSLQPVLGIARYRSKEE